MKKLKVYYIKYKQYIQVDALMYAVMILFILILFIFFG
jgi:hypothetical protein